VLALPEGVLKDMITSRLKTVLRCLFVLVVLAGDAAVVLHPAFSAWSGPEQPSAEAPPDPRAAKPLPAAEAEQPPQAAAPHKPVQFGQRGSAVSFLAFAADGKTLAYGLWPYPENQRSFHGAAVVWDAVAGKEIQRIEGLAGNGALSPDGKTLAIRGSNSSVVFWDTVTGKRLHECEGPWRSPCPSQFAFLPDGRTLAGSFWNDEIYLWDSATGRVIRHFGAEKGGVDSFALSGDGKSILAEHQAHRLEKYDPRIHKGIIPQGGLVNIQEVTCRLWETTTGKHICLVSGPQDKAYRIFYADGTWGRFSPTSGTQEHGYRVRLSPTGKPFFAPAPHMFPFLVNVERREGTIALQSISTGKELRQLEELRKRRIETVVFSPDGRGLALLTCNTGPPEGTVALVYDVADLIDQERARIAKLSAAELEGLWTDLVAPDLAKAYRAFHDLARLPGASALAFLKDHLHLVAAPSAERIARWIADLDSDAFVVREKAQAELQSLGRDAEPALRNVLKGKPSLEQHKRLTQILEKLEKQFVSGATQRGLWVIEVLEQQATPEARQLLEVLAKGAAGAWVTEEAKATLGRIGKGT
jgi:WD40 repeat protein